MFSGGSEDGTMFSRLREFMRRHRYKFLFVSAVGGGALLLKWYAERRLRDWGESETHRMMEKLQKQAHFQSTRSRCAASVDALTPRLLSAVARRLDADALLEALRSGVPNKLHVWRELKRVALMRAVSAVYGGVYLTVLLQVQVHAVGGCLYVDNLQRSAEPPPLDEPAQQHYLACIEHFLTEGVQLLLDDLSEVVLPLADSLSLKDRLGLEGVESLLWRVKSVVELEGRIKLSRYLPAVQRVQPEAAGADRLALLTAETRDLLDNAETEAVVRECCHAGFTRLLDQLTGAFSGQSGGGEDFIPPHAATLPVAKLTPVLTNLPHVLLHPGPDSLTWLTANHHRVQVLAANVYESFSQV